MERPTPPPVTHPKHDQGQQLFLQAGAFSSYELARNVGQQLTSVTSETIEISHSSVEGLYRVWIGPLVNESDIRQLSDRLVAMNLGVPKVVEK